MTSRLRLALMGLLVVAALLAFSGGVAQAGITFTVDSTTDAVDSNPGNGTCDDGAGNCTLRAAIQETNALAGADTITLPAGTYALTIAGAGEDAAATGDLDITDDLTITGAGRDATIIDGGRLDRVFHTAGSISVDISGVTIQNGSTASFFPDDFDAGLGGGIYNGSGAALTLTDVTVRGNWASHGGGGIHNAWPLGNLTLINSTVSGNTGGVAVEGGGGGGIANGGTATLIDSVVSGNRADLSGGGIGNGGTLTLTSSTVSGNRVGLFRGGGISSGGTLTMTDSAVSGNTVGVGGLPDRGEGGGIYFIGGLATITNSTVSGNTANAYGGGIANDIGSLTLTNVSVSGNSAGADGGGIANASGDASPVFHATVALTNVTVSGNSASASGGGIVNGGGINIGTATLTHVTVSGNSANTGGGGIFNDAGDTLTLTNSSVDGNAVTAGGGGGITNVGTLSVTGTTVSGNSAQFGGGGIMNVGSDAIPGPFAAATLINSTVSGNSAGFSGGGIGNGGALTLSNVTLSGNSAPAGGGISRSGFDGVNADNTILANDITGGNCDFPIFSLGHNLSSDDTCGLAGPGDLVNADPLLGPLQDNGGPTQTHALVPGSPAIDAGDNDGCPATDQRGVARPVDGNGYGVAVCDIGAYEAPAGTTVPTPTPTPTPIPTPAPTPVVAAALAAPPAPTSTPAQLPRTGGGAPPDEAAGRTLTVAISGVFVIGMSGIAGLLALRRQGTRHE